MQEHDKQWRGDGSRTDASERDKGGDDETDNVFHDLAILSVNGREQTRHLATSNLLRRRGLNVDAAFNLLSGPSSGPRVIGIGRERGTWLAADTRIATLIKRQQRNIEVGAEMPDIPRRPICEWAELSNLLATGQREGCHLFERGTTASLVAAQ